MNDNQQDSLMTPDERTVCEQIAAAGGSPHSLRAQALLTLDTGASQEEAAAQSGLTPNQIKYWLGRFRNNRLTIFPDALVTAVPQSTSETEPDMSGVDTPPDVKAAVEETAVAPAKAGIKPNKKKGKKEKGKKKVKGKAEKKKSRKKKGKKKKKANKKKESEE